MEINKEIFKSEFTIKLRNMFTEDVSDASNLHKYVALGSLVKEYCSQNWLDTSNQYTHDKEKQVYYFSMEFLIGRLLGNNLINLGIRGVVSEALKELGIELNELEDTEMDAGLGNGGLGRLAACFLDSMASLGIPGHGNGIRYEYGLFEQKIVDGYQVEIPDNWLREGNVWEAKKGNKSVVVKFGGNVRCVQENGGLKFLHENFEPVLAVPYDTPILGYDNKTVNTLRLWSAETIGRDFDFSSFSRGEYLKAVEYKSSVQSISQVLYPDDSRFEGRLLRLKQQYFFVSAGVQSIVRRYRRMGVPLKELDLHIAIHINDTHPSIAVAELMRILVDEENMDWDSAWKITTNIMAYTNHTILSEALERWPVDMFRTLLPRVYMVIEEINRRFCNDLVMEYPALWDRINSMAIIYNGEIRMANLAIVGSHSVNGVAKLHTEILKKQELSNFYNYFPEKFNNKTNGITHRRWLIKSNPGLTDLITNTIGDKWIKNPNKLEELLKYQNDSVFAGKIQDVKNSNKIAFANETSKKYGIEIDPNSIFDFQVKRLHAYKRQVLNVFNILDLYYRLKADPNLDIIPRTFFFGAKASPSYYLAKQTIKLINTVAAKINNDKSIQGKIKLVFLENYRVSLAEKVVAAADISEQISTTTKEASGTGNMKFMMNGAITVATMDGANVEMYEAVGPENIVIFGMDDKQVLNYYKNGGYSANEIYRNDPRLGKILDSLMDGSLGVSNYEFRNIYDSLLVNNDEYFVLKDFDSYVNAQGKVDWLYRDRAKWNQMCIANIAKSGIFSSDNTIEQYSNEIWGTRKVIIK